MFICFLQSQSNSKQCKRCGRYGHHASKCYASTHSKGYLIKVPAN